MLGLPHCGQLDHTISLSIYIISDCNKWYEVSAMSTADAMHVADAFNLFICSCCVAINNEVCMHGTVMFTYNVIDN